MQSPRKIMKRRAGKAARLAVLSLGSAAILASALRGWPEALYSQTPPPSPPQSSLSSMEPEENVVEFRRISNKLLCQCGSCSYIVLSCNHLDCSSATYIRRTIKEGMAQGKSEEVILAGFVEQYGPKVLPEPPRVGFAFLAWLMPFLALGLGAMAVGFALMHLKRKPAIEGNSETMTVESNGEIAATPELPPELMEKYRSEIEREMRN